MIKKLYIVNTVFLLSLICMIMLIKALPALAEKNPPGAIGNPETHLTVEAGQNDIVHIVIGGKEIMTVTKDGIDIQGNIRLSGKINDIGIKGPVGKN